MTRLKGKFVETKLINPIKLISLSKDFMQQVEQNLKEYVITPIHDNEIDIKKNVDG